MHLPADKAPTFSHIDTRAQLGIGTGKVDAFLWHKLQYRTRFHLEYLLLVGHFALCTAIEFGGTWGGNQRMCARLHRNLNIQRVATDDSPGWVQQIGMANSSLRVEWPLYRQGPETGAVDHSCGPCPIGKVHLQLRFPAALTLFGSHTQTSSPITTLIPER